MARWTAGRMDGQTADRRMGLWLVERTDGRTDGWMDGQTDGQTDVWADSWTDIPRDCRLMEGWTEGGTN